MLAGLVCEPCLDLGRKGEPFIPLTVRLVEPATKPDGRELVAVCMRDELCVTEHGEIFDLAGLVERLRERETGERGSKGRGRIRRELPEQLAPCWIITDNALDLLGYLNASACADSPMWNWQCGLRAPSAWRPEADSKRGLEWIVPKPVRVGFASRKSDRRRAKGRARWYELLDAGVFCELPGDGGTPDAAELLAFAIDLRRWSVAHQLPMLPTASAYGSRLLRDARFGGGWRRKVPASTNQALRRRLPGNHYQLAGARDKTYREVHKLDQKGAHHYAAANIAFPHPDELNAAGWFRRPAPREGARATGPGAIEWQSDQWRELLARPGIFTLAITVPELLALDEFVIPALRRPEPRWRTITSVELAHIQQLRAEGWKIGLGDIWSAYTSPDTDDRLREYAYWAGSQSGPRWLKPLLLSPYGLLAVRPRKFRNVWRWCAKPDGSVGFQTRWGQLVGYERTGKRERESQTANVLWRCLIESSVRLESLRHAQRLRGAGYRPLAVYADAVFAIGDGEPPAPLPWRYEGVVHDLTFDGPSRYRSREESRLPGTPRSRHGLQRSLKRKPKGGDHHSDQTQEQDQQQRAGT